MGDGRYQRPLLLADREYLFHKGHDIRHLEIFRYIFFKDGGGKGAKALAPFDLAVQQVFGVGAAGIGEDGPAPSARGPNSARPLNQPMTPASMRRSATFS